MREARVIVVLLLLGGIGTGRRGATVGRAAPRRPPAALIWWFLRGKGPIRARYVRLTESGVPGQTLAVMYMAALDADKKPLTLVAGSSNANPPGGIPEADGRDAPNGCGRVPRPTSPARR
jgi:hypothetical protein